jgi:PAS domain S-box-containing protein
MLGYGSDTKDAGSSASGSATFLAGGGELGLLIRSFDWSSTPMGPPDQWPQSLKTSLSICLNTSVVSALYWGPEFRVIYNDAYAPALAERHPSALGQPLCVVWREIWDVLGPQLEEVVSSGNGFSIKRQQLMMKRRGRTEETFWDYSFAPISGESGDVLGVFVTANDVTDNVLNERRLSTIAERQRAMFQKMPGFIALLDGPDHVYRYANDAYVRIAGRPLIGLPVEEALPELEGQGYFEALDEAYRTGESFTASAMQLRLKGEKKDRWIDFIYQPLTDDAGEVTGIFVGGYEVTEHVEALQGLAAREHELQTLTDALPVLISYIDADERYQFNNKIYDEWFSQGRDAIRGQKVRDVVGEPAYAKAKPRIDAALAGERIKFEQLMPYTTTTPRHIQVEYVPRIAGDGSVQGFYALVQDITAMKALENQRAELTNELSHRIKNSLAVVQAIVSQTLKQVSTIEEGREAITGRVAALARAQDILTSTSWAEADIRQIVDAALEPHRDAADRFTLHGPPMKLTAQQSLGMSLAIHELATNAIKYGALSNAVGKVAIEWELFRDRSFTFQWRESGGPAVVAPTRHGFGSRLIERIVAPYFKGTSNLSYLPAGLVFNLTGTTAE